MATILIADDHPITREPLARLFRHEGYDVITAVNGLEALNLYRARRPDLILLDMTMPKLGGLGFLQAAAEDGRSSVPVIILTGVIDSSDVARARHIGVSEVLTKTKFSIDELFAAVRRHLGAATTDADSSAAFTSNANSSPDFSLRPAA